MSTPKTKKLKLILKKPETTCGTGVAEVYKSFHLFIKNGVLL
jgi:hypothetical protein